jgi:hypothetical protein
MGLPTRGGHDSAVEYRDLYTRYMNIIDINGHRSEPPAPLTVITG